MEIPANPDTKSLIDESGANTEERRRSGYFIAAFSTVSSGLSTVVGKWNLESIPTMLMNSLIFTIATIILSGPLIAKRGLRGLFSLSRKAWLWVMLFTVSSWFAVWAFWAGVNRMDPTLAAFLNRAEVPVAIALGIVFLKERFTKFETLGAILAIAGIVVMRITLRIEYSSGFWLVLLGSLLFGVTEFISKIAVSHVEPTVLAYIRNGLLAVGYWTVLLTTDYSFDGLNRVWLGVLALGLLGPILSRLFYLKALQRLQLSKVAVISQSQPVVVVLVSLLAFGQLPTLREIAGGILLTSGCLILVISDGAATYRMSRNRPCASGSNG